MGQVYDTRIFSQSHLLIYLLIYLFINIYLFIY